MGDIFGGSSAPAQSSGGGFDGFGEFASAPSTQSNTMP